MILTHEQVTQLCELLGVDIAELYKTKIDAEKRTGKRVVRIIVPTKQMWFCGVPVVFGPVDKPTAEVA